MYQFAGPNFQKKRSRGAAHEVVAARRATDRAGALGISLPRPRSQGSCAMLSGSLGRWIRKALQRPRRRLRTVRPRHRLWVVAEVQMLEERCLLSSTGPGLVVDPTAVDATHILVQFKADAPDIASLHILDGTTIGDALPLVAGLREVTLAPSVSVSDALAAYGASQYVVSAEADHILHAEMTPNDPGFSQEWGLNNTGQTGGTPDADIDAPEAWNFATSLSTVIVAVLDTGVDYTHPDLAAAMWTNTAEANGQPGVDDDGDGFVDDIHGYDFVNNDGDPMDDHYHGTHVAGTIAAVANNGIGIAGVAPNAQIMALKFLDSSGNGTTANAIRALNYAVQMGATISNNSYGGSTASDADPLFAEAIHNAAASGHIFVAGAGNSGTNNDVAGFYPANFNLDNIVSVAATDDNDQLASFSNYGATTVDLAAPGVNIYSTSPGNSYRTLSGTSMATPHVTGVMALVRGEHPDWTYQQVIAQVLNTVDYVPSLDGKVATAGRLNAARAVGVPDTNGPRVVFTDPSGGVGGVISTMQVTFDKAIDPTTFDQSDIISFTGPGGPIAVAGVSVVAGSHNRTFAISFPAQFAHGTYQLVLGPNITDTSGNPMNQDGDAVNGETLDDRYVATFTIGDTFVFHSADTPTNVVPLTVSSSSIVVGDDFDAADVNVQVNVAFPDVGVLDLSLVSPSGTVVDLAPAVGTAGANYQITIFDDEASTPIGSGSAPFIGSYRPSSPLSALDGQDVHGTWQLRVNNAWLYSGTLNSWSLSLLAAPPHLTVGNVTLAEGNSGTTNATFTVSLSNVIGQPVTVDYSAANGTATAGSDYQAVAGTLTFNPGETTKTVTVPVYGDTLDEPDETFFLNLSNASNATIQDGQAVGTIVNDEVGLSVNDVSVVEGNSGTVNAIFAVLLSQPSAQSVVVQYATADGNTTAGTDYTAASGTLTFAPGETSKTVSVAVKGDTRYERDETFFMNLSSATNAIILDPQAVGTIVNDDPIPLVTVNDPTLTEGNSGTKNLAFSVSLSNTSDYAVTVPYATADGSAIAGQDYTAKSGTLNFTPGLGTLLVTVPLTGDAVPEPDETFYLNLGTPTGA